MKKNLLLFWIFISLTHGVGATTWYPAEHKCPVCKHKDEYQNIGSYGSYIYQWPSKYQYVFWPLTDNPSVYCCSKCHFSVFMWDFDSVSTDKVDTLKKFLSTVKLEKKFKSYLEIPMTTRLEIAESVYKILGQDEEFWSLFYRVTGYHFDQENHQEKAREYRLKSLDHARSMLSDEGYKGQEKEIMYIIAAMNNFTGQKDSAMFYLDKAGLLTYENSKWKENNVKGLDAYLTDLIQQHREFMLKEEE